MQVTFPTQNIWGLLRERVTRGESPDEATDAILAPYHELPLAEIARPAVLRAAEIEHRHHTRMIENKAFEMAPGKSEEYRTAIHNQLAKATFKIEGRQVAWEDASAAQHKIRILKLEDTIAGTMKTRIKHLCSIELIEEFGVGRLGEIPDWQNLLAQRVSQRLDAKGQQPS